MMIASSQLNLETRSLLFSHIFPCRNSWGWISPQRSAALKWWWLYPTPRESTAPVPCLCHIFILLVSTLTLKWTQLMGHVCGKSTDLPPHRAARGGSPGWRGGCPKACTELPSLASLGLTFRLQGLLWSESIQALRELNLWHLTPVLAHLRISDFRKNQTSWS